MSGTTTMTMDTTSDEVVDALQRDFGPRLLYQQQTLTGMPVFWVDREALTDLLGYLKAMARPFDLLYDLSAIDERLREHRPGLPASDFTVFYQLLSIGRNRDLLLKVPLAGHDLSAPTATGVFPAASWYEREVWDMFGISFAGHPHLERILMPPTWSGHPLRKDYPARATEFDPYTLTLEGQRTEQDALRFEPEAWGCSGSGTAPSSCSSISGRTTPLPMVPSALCCSWTARKSSTACRTSAITTGARRRWLNASPGTALFPTPIASITPVG